MANAYQTLGSQICEETEENKGNLTGKELCLTKWKLFDMGLQNLILQIFFLIFCSIFFIFCSVWNHLLLDGGVVKINLQTTCIHKTFGVRTYVIQNWGMNISFSYFFVFECCELYTLQFFHNFLPTARWNNVINLL